MTQLVTTTRIDHVMVVSMQREHKRNAVDRALADELDAALSVIDDDPEIWVGVLTGTASVFSAGSDLTSRGDYVTERGGEYGVIRRDRSKPLIAAVEGLALGGGFEIVLACDLVVAASDATFGLPEVARGLTPTCGALFRAPRALPLNLAREMVLTGQRVGAERLHHAGVVNRLAEPGAAVAAAVDLARQICANSPSSVRACLQAMDDYVTVDDEAGWAVTSAAQQAIRDTEDLREGLEAFFEKRPPRWTGR